MTKEVPAQLQGMSIGLAVGTMAVLDDSVHLVIIAMAIVFGALSYILENRGEP